MQEEEKEKGETKEYILENLNNLEKKQKIRKLLVFAIIFVIIIIIGFLSLSFYAYYQSPEKTLGLGANIESALLSAEGKIVYLKLDGGSLDKNITKIKFLFIDSEENEFFYETSEGTQDIEVPFKKGFWDWFLGRQFVGSYDYEINSESVGIVDFSNIKEIEVSFEYKTETGESVDSPVLDTRTPTTTSSGSSRTSSGSSGDGDDGGDDDETPEPTPTPCTNDTGCSAFGNFCNENLPYTCTLGADGCLNRLDRSDCNSEGKICYLGECVEPGICGNGLKEPGELCDNGINNGDIGYCNTECDGFVGDYYISINDENCDDNGNGTSEVPWCNLTKPCASGGVIPYRWVPEGSVVIVREGNYGYYSETTQSNCINNISLVQRNEWTTYMADAGDNVIIDGMKLGTNWAYDAQGRHYQIWDGFKITGGIGIVYTDYIMIRNCDLTIHPLPYEGFYAPYYIGNAEVIDARSSSNITIENNSIHNSYRGISVSSGENWIIRDNEIYRMGEDGMSISSTDNLLMENNYVHDSNSKWTGITFIGWVDYNGGTGFISGEAIIQDITGATGIIKSDNGEGETTLALYQTSEENLVKDPSFTIIKIDNVSESFTISGNNSHYFTKENLFKVRQSRNEVYYTLGVYTLKSFNYDAVSGTTTLFVNEDIINDSSPYGTAYPAYYVIRNNRSEILLGVHYTDTTHRDGFQMGGSSNVIIKNNYFINTGQGFKLDGGQLYNITVVGNVINTGGWNMLLTAFVRNLNIINNTVVGNRITFSQDITSNIHNNIIDVMYISGDWNAEILSHRSNIFRGNPDGYKSSIYTFEVDYNTELVNYNISNLFVNETNHDFRVRMNSPACDGSLNGMAAVPVGALECVCRNDTDCIFGGSCVDWECQGTKNCLETEYSCGSFPNCVNCNFLDGCYRDYYREYSCTSNGAGCEYIEDNCVDDCSCSCGGYGDIESTEMENCDDGMDNDCDGNTDGSDYGCQAVSGIPLDYSAYFRFEGSFTDYTNNNTVAWLGVNKDEYEKRLDDNYAKTFDGVANRIDLPNNENFNLFSNFTISAWVKTLNAKTDAIICRGSLFYAFYGQYVISSEGADDKVKFTFALANGTSRKTFISEQSYNIGEWNHVAAKFNGTTGSLFINGVKVKENVTGFSTLQQAPGSYNVAYIGEGKEGRYLNGSLDDIIIYRRALTDAEILQIYNTQKVAYVSSLSPFTSLLNWLKGLLTTKTGNAILAGKTITGNAVNETNENGKLNFKIQYIILFLLIVATLIIAVVIVKIKKKRNKKKIGKSIGKKIKRR